MIDAAPTGPELSRGYEDLRARAIEHAGTRATHGLATLLRWGLAAWIAAWVRLVPPSRPAVIARNCAPLTISWSSDVAALLADMALETRRRVLA